MLDLFAMTSTQTSVVHVVNRELLHGTVELCTSTPAQKALLTVDVVCDAAAEYLASNPSQHDVLFCFGGISGGSGDSGDSDNGNGLSTNYAIMMVLSKQTGAVCQIVASAFNTRAEYKACRARQLYISIEPRCNFTDCPSEGEPTLHMCTGCYVALYCSSKCQHADWKSHRQQTCKDFLRYFRAIKI